MSNFYRCARWRDPQVNSLRGVFRGNARSHALGENRKRPTEVPSSDAAERMLKEIARIRSDDAVRTAVLGWYAHRTKVTAVVADL